MTDSPISTQIHHDILVVTSNNPPVNALGLAVRQGLVAAIAEAEANDAVKAVVIRCEGQRIQLWINGLETVDYTEEEQGIEQEGIIGLQIHGGEPSEAWYKDITIRELGE